MGYGKQGRHAEKGYAFEYARQVSLALFFIFVATRILHEVFKLYIVNLCGNFVFSHSIIILMRFKERVHQHYYQCIISKIELLNNAINDLRESSRNETKSSAGDKYETTRAMLQLEQDKINKQLKEAQEQKAIFEQIDPSVYSNQIIKGSLVKTNRGYLFVSLALGKATIDGLTVIALSPHSPLGIKLMGLQTNDTAEINGIPYLIEAIE